MGNGSSRDSCCCVRHSSLHYTTEPRVQTAHPSNEQGFHQHHPPIRRCCNL